MRVVVLSDHETAGGAAIAGSRLAHPIAERHETHYLVHNPDFKTHPWCTWPLRPAYATDPKAYRKRYPLLDHGWRRGPLEPVQPTSQSVPIDLHARLRWILARVRPDIVWVQNLHGGMSRGWDERLVQTASYFAPVVWTLHDMWSFTGRCAYSYDCSRFMTGCNAECPTPQEYPALPSEQIAPGWTNKRRLLDAGRPIHGVASSRWLAQQAVRGIWPASAIHTIATGVPMEVYRPMDRSLCRDKLGIPNDGRPIVLVSAHELGDRRKGGNTLPKIAAEIQNRPLVLLFMGQGDIPVHVPGVESLSLGFIESPETQAEIYSAADIMLHPAPVDNLPNVVMESLACGTPVVAYPIGGVVEMIHPGKTGWLSASLTPKGLAQTLDRAIWQVRQGMNLRESSRAFAADSYDVRKQALQYEQLFENVLHSSFQAVPKPSSSTPRQAA